MSFLHQSSCECLKSELDLFSLPMTQTTIESSSCVEYKPVSSLSDQAPLEFLVAGAGEEYIDLAHTMIKLNVQLTPYNESTDVKVAPVNNFLHSMFSQVDVFFNQKLVTPTNTAYPYRAYIETLLNYGPDAKQSHLGTSLWMADTAGYMDEQPGTVGGKNKGLLMRHDFLNGGKTLDLIGHLHCDIFNQDRFLLNGVEMRVRLVRSKDAFCLMDASDNNYSVHISEASLLVRRSKINPGVLVAHAKTLATTTAKYPLTRVEVKSFSMHSGILGDCLDNVIIGQLPKRIILGFVKNKAFNGDRKLNPFNFQNFDINYLSLYVDGTQIPSKPLQPKFSARSRLYVDSYHTLFSGTGIHFLNEGNDIDRLEYPNGFCLFAFDLTPDMSAHCGTHWSLVRNGSVRIEVRFDYPLADTINCIVYAEYDNILEIDSARQVVLDYNS